MPRIQTFDSKKTVTDVGARITTIDLDQLVFKASEKAPGMIYPDPVTVVENAKKPGSQFNSDASDTHIEIRYNTNVFKQNESLTERLATKEEIDTKESMGKLNPASRAYSKHRAVTVQVTSDAVCDGITLDSDNLYSYLLTIINAPNGGNSKKGNGVSSSKKDMQTYFSGTGTDNYLQAMMEIYKTALSAQATSEAVIIAAPGMGVYLSSLEGRDLYLGQEFVKEEVISHRNDFTFIQSTQTLYFTDKDGQFQQIETPKLDVITKFLADNEAVKYGSVHLHMGTIKSFGDDFDRFVKALPARNDRPLVTDVNKANYQALLNVLLALDADKSNTIKTIVLCAMRKEGVDLFKTANLKNIDVLQTTGDMLQATQQISKLNIRAGLLGAGSDHDIGGATNDCMVKVQSMLPGEEQISLTSNYLKAVAKALTKGNVKYIPYTMDICDHDIAQLPKNAQTVSVSQFSIVNSEKQNSQFSSEFDYDVEQLTISG